ncbi:MAG: DUF2169 domain-containing protein [Polyangiaceae bacterium]
MKLVKPMAVSFGFRTFLILGKQELCVTSMVGFALGAGVRRLVPEMALMPAIGEAAGGMIDEGLPKPGAEVLLYGSCHTPGALPLPATTVRMRVTASGAAPDAPALVDKELVVFGDRYWAGTAARDPAEHLAPSSEATEPVPFTEMPLGWERAFGGPRHPKNPLGRGIDRIETGEGIHRVPLPNVELPSKLVTKSSQHPEAAGFGPLDLSWPQRQSLAGSYGGSWLEEDFPGFARDTEPSFFNLALPDQRLADVFRGDEEYVLENMNPLRTVLRGALPGVAARVLLRRKGSLDVEDVAMRLDTVVFLPGKEIGVLVFRGLTRVLEDDASDVAFALAACEDLGAPRPMEHYVAALDRRLDRDESPKLALDESDLLPSFAVGTGMAELLGKLEDPTKERRERVRERALQRVRQQLVAEGVADPDALIAEATRKSPLEERLERLPDPADPEDLSEYAAALEQFEEYADQQREGALQGAEKELAEAEKVLTSELAEMEKLGSTTAEAARKLRDGIVKIEQARRTVRGEPPVDDAAPIGEGPPAPQTPRMLELFREAAIEPDPGHVKKLQQADQVALETYRGSAHYMPPARLLDADARARTRHALLELRAEGHRLAERDFTRSDLSGLDLQHAELRRALLEGADLTRTNLAGAELAGVVLAHATLHETKLDGASLEGANLGATVVEGASFASADLRGATLARCKLRSASFRGSDLTDVEWLEAEIGAVDFEEAHLPETTFLYKIELKLPERGAPPVPPIPADLTKCRFPRAKLTKATFLHSRLGGVDFTGADLELVTFLAVAADGACFRGAWMRKLHAVMGCSFEGANFDGADLTDAFLRGSSLKGASFEGARLDGADLSECDLTGAKLTAAQMKSALLIRTDLSGASLAGANLMEAMLQKSRLHGADLSGANLFAANLGLVRLDDATKVHGANLKRALMLPKARKNP